MKVSKWGNSLAVRLPAPVVEALNLKAGDEINIRLNDANNFVIERKRTREEIIAHIMKTGFKLPPGFKWTREEANARR